MLADRYDEVPTARGITNLGKHVVELFTSRDGESWTMIVTDARGVSCGVAVGQTWQSVPVVEPIESPGLTDGQGKQNDDHY